MHVVRAGREKMAENKSMKVISCKDISKRLLRKCYFRWILFRKRKKDITNRLQYCVASWSMCVMVINQDVPRLRCTFNVCFFQSLFYSPLTV